MIRVRKVSQIAWIGLIVMAVLSFGNFAGQSFANAVISIGILLFFVNRAVEKNPDDCQTLSFQPIREQLKHKETFLWLFLPTVVTLTHVTISSNFLPEYIEYEKGRAGAFIAIEFSIVSALLFFVFALGEEIVWRAFFQTQLMKGMTPIIAIVLSSILFTLGHYQPGDPALVLYGLTFTFINGALFGFIYYKTGNVWISTAAHFLANMVEVFLYTL